jgi:hypothetical protein
MFWFVIVRKPPERVIHRSYKPDALFSHAGVRTRLFFALIEIWSCSDNNAAILGESDRLKHANAIFAGMFAKCLPDERFAGQFAGVGVIDSNRGPTKVRVIPPPSLGYQ